MRSMANKNTSFFDAIKASKEDGSEKRNFLRFVEKYFPFTVEFAYSTVKDNWVLFLRKGEEKAFLIVDLDTFEILEWEELR